MRKQLVEKRIPMMPHWGKRENSFWVEAKTQDLLLCADTLRSYFDLPYDMKRLTVVLSNRYSDTCYQLVCAHDEECAEIVVDGKRTDEVLFRRADVLVLNFIRKHGKCYASIEYQG